MTTPQRHGRRPRHRRFGRIGIIALAFVTLFAWTAGVASAHVTVNPNSVTAGSYAKLTFRVPTESATASTVALTVALPAEHPFPSVSVMQLPGWTAEVTKTPLNPPVTQGRFTLTEAVTSITWTADDKVGIRPGEFMEFPISVGPVPDVPSMLFPADQTYSDGSVVRWDQERTGGDEPDHPAPALTIAAADSTGAGSGTAATGTAAAGADSTAGPTVTGVDADQAAQVAPAPSAATSSDNTARILGVLALVLAALALLVAVTAGRRKSAAPGAASRPAAPAGRATDPPSPPSEAS